MYYLNSLEIEVFYSGKSLNIPLTISWNLAETEKAVKHALNLAESSREMVFLVFYGSSNIAHSNFLCHGC